jgi:integrase
MTISPARMKMKRPHRVPLSDQAVAILERLAEHRLGAHVFPGSRGNANHMPRQSVNRLMDRLGIDATPHGFRSSFKSWTAASNDFDLVAVEFALNHVQKGLEQAYQRDDLLTKRQPIMQQWADHCCRATNVHDIGEARKTG